MAADQKKRDFKYWVKRFWNNYVVRNIIVAIVFLIILAVIASVLLNIFTRHNKYRDVPDFVGVSLEQAYDLAKTDRLRVEINDSLYVPTITPGVILEQRPEAGTKVKSGRRIFVTVNSYRQKMVDVPYVAGFSLRQAKNLLETAGLQIENLIYVDDIATNNVLEQRVGGQLITQNKSLRAEMGTGVTLTVGRAPDAEPVITPKVVGLSLRDARGRLWEAGLNIGRVAYDNDINTLNQSRARVYMQNPGPSGLMVLGSEVSIYLTVDSLRLANGIHEADGMIADVSRRRFLADSLTRMGFPSDLIEGEVDYILRRDRGELTPADSVRSVEEILRRIGERGDEGEEDEFFN